MNFHMGDFVMSTWAFEKYNFTFLNIITCLIKKGFSIGKLWNSWWSIQNFLKSNFHLNCQIFSLAATTIICFIWHIGSFQLWKICLQNNHMNNHSFSPLILSCKKWCYMNHSYFKTKYDFCMRFERCLMSISHFVTQHIKHVFNDV